jgi:hypothetical protein
LKLELISKQQAKLIDRALLVGLRSSAPTYKQALSLYFKALHVFLCAAPRFFSVVNFF